MPSNVADTEFEYNGKLEAEKVRIFLEFTQLPHSLLADEEPQAVECAFIQSNLAFC